MSTTRQDRIDTEIRPYNCPVCNIPPQVRHDISEVYFTDDLEITDVKRQYRISCPKCGKRTVGYDKLEDAIEDWNKWVAYITTIRKVLKNEN